MINGVQPCKFTRGGTTTVNLLYSSVQEPWVVPNYLIQKGLRGDRFIVRERDYAEFLVRDELWKYEDGGVSKLNEIMQYKQTLVEFYPHSDGPAASRNYGAKLFFWITSVQPFALFENLTSNDAVYIRLISKIDIHPIPQNLSGMGTGFGFNHGFNN